MIRYLFSSSLLKCSLCTSILFPNSVNIFITNVLCSLSGKWFISISLFFQGVSLALFQLRVVPLPFCLTSSASMSLCETVTYCGLEGVFLCGNIPMSAFLCLSVPNAFGG